MARSARNGWAPGFTTSRRSIPPTARRGGALAPANAPQITLMAAVALADTVAAFVAEPPAIKWPNDILLRGKKLAGILTDSSCDSKRIEFVILGIGVNLNYPRAQMPETLRQRA